MENARIRKTTPRCVIADYDVQLPDSPHTIANTIFYIANDAPRSDIAFMVVHFLYPSDPKKKPEINIEAIWKKSVKSQEMYAMLPAERESELGAALATLIGDKSEKKSYSLTHLIQPECIKRDERNPYDYYIQTLSSGNRGANYKIGSQCKLDLTRILSVINVAVDNRVGHVEDPQLKSIGQPVKLRDGR